MRKENIRDNEITAARNYHYQKKKFLKFNRRAGR